jgi:hypothetical protein
VELYGLRSSRFGFRFGFSQDVTHHQVPDVEVQSPVCRAARGGHLPVVQLFVSESNEMLAPVYDTHTTRTTRPTAPAQEQGAHRELCNALWSAAKEGHNEVIEYLLDCGAEVTAPSPIAAYARLPSTALRPATLMRLITGAMPRPPCLSSFFSLMLCRVPCAVCVGACGVCGASAHSRA